jgi:hypothetical protein
MIKNKRTTTATMNPKKRKKREQSHTLDGTKRKSSSLLSLAPFHH